MGLAGLLLLEAPVEVDCVDLPVEEDLFPAPQHVPDPGWSPNLSKVSENL